MGLLIGAAALGGACSSEDVAPSPPSGSVQGKLTFNAVGPAQLEAYVRVQMYGTDETEQYAFGGVTIEDSTFGADWTIDSVEFAPEGWPVDVTGPLAFETRAITVRASSPHFEFITEPTFHVTVEHDGRALSTPITGALDRSWGGCPGPSFEPVPSSVGASVRWSRELLPSAVPDGSPMWVDPLERVYTSSLFNVGTSTGTRIVATPPSGLASLVELPWSFGLLTPGTGSGPTITGFESNAAGTGMNLRIGRFDAELRPVWSHTLDGVDLFYGAAIGASNGLLLVAVAPIGPLLVDGEEVAPADAVARRVALFDETSGEYIASRPFADAYLIAGIGKGAFAVATYAERGPSTLSVVETDLTERFTAPLHGVPSALALGPDGSIWVGTDGAWLERFGADGAPKASFATPAFRTIAPLADGRVLVAGIEAIAVVGAGLDPKIGGAPPPAAAWCSVASGYVSAAGPKGPVLAATLATTDSTTWTTSTSLAGLAL